MIEWSKLKPYQNDQRRNFEELCCQIARGLHEEEENFTRVDDSGGGDGVEFYLTLPNGDQWGWQAKFYYPEPRLNKSGRKRSITNSLKRACEIHPNLKKWFLCTPTNFTPDEQTWFKNTLPQLIPENMDVELEHWGDSEFNNWLSKPDFRGKLHYFFGKLELDLDWFKRQFDKQMADIGDKFDASLHTETRVDANLHALLGDEMFVCQLTELIEKPKSELCDLEEAIDDIKRRIPNEIEWTEEEKAKLIEAAGLLQYTLVDTICLFEQTKEFLIEKHISEAQSVDWTVALTQLEGAIDTYKTIGTESGTSKIKYSGNRKNKEEVLHRATEIIHRPGYLVDSLLHYSFYSAMQWCELINQSNLNIFGKAGVGKTHIACNICEDRLKNGLPALFVRGSLFTTNQSIEGQLQDILGISLYFNWEDFLQALSAAAEAYHTRIPLIIDGLNESTHNGTYSNIWKLGLKGLIQEISKTKNLILVTTYRTSYKEAIWGKETTPNVISAEGFNSDEVKQEAIDKYFEAYKIKADLTLAPLRQFEQPLHLKLFCETKNRERKTEVQVYVGEQTLFEVFDEYLEQCNEEVRKRLERRRGTTIVQPALNKIAEHLWQNRSRNILVEELVKLTDNPTPFRSELATIKSVCYRS